MLSLARYLVNAVAVGLAFACARRVASFRVVAWTLAFGLVAELAGEALLAWVLPPVPTQPLTGTLRWAIYADRALFIAWPALLAGCSVRVLWERRAWPVAAGYAVAAFGLAVTYPTTRGGVLRLCYLGIDLAALLIAFVSLIMWLRRHWGKTRADVSVTVTAVLVVGHLMAVIAGPYKFGLFGPEWHLMQLAYLFLFVVVSLLQGGALWESRQSVS